MNYQERLYRQSWGWGCEPATILMASSLAISAAGTAASVVGQARQAAAQETQQKELVVANNKVTADQVGSLRIQQSQDAESRAREVEKARLASQRAQATAKVAAGESGVSGNSVDALLNEYSASLGQFKEATNRQGALNTQATDAQIAAIQTGARYQNLQINAPITGPNYAAAAVSLAGDGLKTYQAYKPDAFKAKAK